MRSCFTIVCASVTSNRGKPARSAPSQVFWIIRAEGHCHNVLVSPGRHSKSHSHIVGESSPASCLPATLPLPVTSACGHHQGISLFNLNCLNLSTSSMESPMMWSTYSPRSPKWQGAFGLGLIRESPVKVHVLGSCTPRPTPSPVNHWCPNSKDFNQATSLDLAFPNLPPNLSFPSFVRGCVCGCWYSASQTTRLHVNAGAFVISGLRH
jgi:hypothetical protein